MSHIKMTSITKVYPNGVIANDNAHFEMEKGEIHAIAGENGAGKSTLMKILYGAEKAQGEIYIDDVKQIIDSPKTANSLGIGMVYQHFMLINEFSVWENIFFGKESTNFWGKLKISEMKQKANELCQRYNMPLNINAKCGNLSVSECQKVEILKVLARNAQTIILDEPTAVLTPQETQELFAQLRSLKADGYSIIIITHKLKEIKILCDRVTVMRQGKTVGTYDVSQVSETDISKLMVGRDIEASKKTKPTVGDTVLEVKNLSIEATENRKAVNDVSFQAKRGEILCFAGVVGNGQHEVINAITGLDNSYNGEILLDGQPIKNLKIAQVRKLGLSHIPEDRLKTGTVADFSVFENLIAVDFQSHCKLGFIDFKTLKEKCSSQIQDFGVKGHLEDKLSSLSGGNMQKVVIARELGLEPSLLVADQPTRGVDIGAIESIHKRIIELRDSGKAVILVSADLSEVFALADRILVFHNGEITAHIKDVSSVNEEVLGRYMLGVEKMAKEELA
jgi:general nucleoside transport system ATP-binding protein